MYPITLQSGDKEYLIGEAVSLDKNYVISELPYIIQKCLDVSILEFYEKEGKIIAKGQSIRIKDQHNVYTIPFHDTFTQNDYIMYWFMLYICEHASHVYATPEKMFVNWIYNMFDTITEQVELNIDGTIIYPGSLWVLLDSDQIFREYYILNSVEPVG